MLDSEYHPLGRYLANLRSDTWPATFAEIERILGFELPTSARTYPAWWGNNGQGSRHTRVWLEQGWHTSDLNLGRGQVTFRHQT